MPACQALQSHGPTETERVHDQGGGSGQLVLRAGGAKNLLLKRSRRKRLSRQKMATYNVRTLPRDEHIYKKSKNLVVGMGCNRDKTRSEECFTILQTLHK